MLKVQAIGLLIIFTVFIFYMILARPAFENGEKCFTDYLQKTKILSEQAVAQEWEIEDSCIKNRETLISLNQCYRNLKTKNAAFSLYFNYPNVKNNYESNLNRHNQICSNLPVPLID